jgi:hypothetical protein
MRIDLYMKGVLTVIAVLIAVIAFRQYVSPDTVVQAQGAFTGVQFSGGQPSPSFLTPARANFGTTVPMAIWLESAG